MSIQAQMNKLQRLDTLENKTWFKVSGLLFISGNRDAPQNNNNFVLGCYDYEAGVLRNVKFDAMVEVINPQAVFDVCFGRIDTVIGNLQEATKEINSCSVSCGQVHDVVVRRLEITTGRLKSHLSDLRECLRDKETPILWSRTTPQFDTEGIE